MKSNIRPWRGWPVVVVVVVFMFIAYRYTNLNQPVNHAVRRAEQVIGQVLPNNPLGIGASEMLLTQARESYAKGDMDEAEAGYQNYIRHNPDNADVHSELGNVFYAAGNLPEAAQAYYDAGSVFIDQHQTEAASVLLPRIAQINPALANALSMKMAHANQSNPSDSEQAVAYPDILAPPQSAYQRY